MADEGEILDIKTADLKATAPTFHQQSVAVERAPWPWVMTEAALIVTGPDMDPSVVTRELALDATSTRSPGFDRWDTTGSTDGRWRLEFDDDSSRDFSLQMDAVLSVAEEKRVEIESLTSQGNEAVLAVSGFAGHDCSLPFSAQQMARAASIGIPLVLIPNLNER
ncbi:DUF4279 domain-containing protein [Streptomyces xanthochromogenes]|uniref:DUF4279 domain-containing protein n=1 Tax=Streptomyces xanthochromogenes TaxID=67384 RepID=UPI003431D464